jgi:hypothetical protein
LPSWIVLSGQPSGFEDGKQSATLVLAQRLSALLKKGLPHR